VCGPGGVGKLESLMAEVAMAVAPDGPSRGVKSPTQLDPIVDSVEFLNGLQFFSRILKNYNSLSAHNLTICLFRST